MPTLIMPNDKVIEIAVDDGGTFKTLAFGLGVKGPGADEQVQRWFFQNPFGGQLTMDDLRTKLLPPHGVVIWREAADGVWSTATKEGDFTKKAEQSFVSGNHIYAKAICAAPEAAIPPKPMKFPNFLLPATGSSQVDVGTIRIRDGAQLVGMVNARWAGTHQSHEAWILQPGYAGYLRNHGGLDHDEFGEIAGKAFWQAGTSVLVCASVRYYVSFPQPA